MKKEFDGKKFQKTQKRFMKYILLIGVIAVASIVCAFAIGKGIHIEFLEDLFGMESSFQRQEREAYRNWIDGLSETIDKGPDPADYYGTYYAFIDNEIISMTYSANGCVYSASNGLKDNQTDTYHEYDYVSAEYAQAIAENSKYEGCPAIFMHSNVYEDNGFLFWVVSSNPYEFVRNYDESHFTSSKIDFSNLMGDPKDYYYTYTFNVNSYVTFYADGTALFVRNGESVNFNYLFVNEDWLKKYTYESFAEGLFLYNEGSNSYEAFEYIDNQTLKYGESIFKVIDKGTDPADYYGTYYSFNDNEIVSVTFSANGCLYSRSNGLKGNKTDNSYEYEYVSSEFAQFIIENSKYEGCPAIFVYADSNKEFATVFWVTSSNPYEFVVNDGESHFTSSEINFAELMGDPKDYYCTYTFNANSYVTFYDDGTAVFVKNGESINYFYSFVNEGWLKKHTTKSITKGLMLYKDASDYYEIFEYVDNKTLKYGETIFRDIDKGTDPADYYGTYYAFNNNQLMTITFGADNCICSTSNGMKGNQTDNSYDYEYFSAEYAKAIVKNSKYEGCPAIFVYPYANKESAMVFWVTSSNPYEFVRNHDELSFTSSEINFAELMGDPKDYYYTYAFNANSYVTFYDDGTAVFVINGETEDYIYLFVNESWLKQYTNESIAKGLMLYNEGSAQYEMFEYVDSNTVKYGNYSFTR